MRPPVSIDRRLLETKPSTAGEALLIAVVRKHKSGPPPGLPPSAMARIWRTLGERPPRLSPLPAWRAVRALVVVLAALLSVQAVAVVGIRVAAIVQARFAQRKAQPAAHPRGSVPASHSLAPNTPAAQLPLPPVPPPLPPEAVVKAVSAPPPLPAQSSTRRAVAPAPVVAAPVVLASPVAGPVASVAPAAPPPPSSPPSLPAPDPLDA